MNISLRGALGAAGFPHSSVQTPDPRVRLAIAALVCAANPYSPANAAAALGCPALVGRGSAPTALREEALALLGDLLAEGVEVRAGTPESGPKARLAGDGVWVTLGDPAQLIRALRWEGAAVRPLPKSDEESARALLPHMRAHPERYRCFAPLLSDALDRVVRKLEEVAITMHRHYVQVLRDLGVRCPV